MATSPARLIHAVSAAPGSAETGDIIFVKGSTAHNNNNVIIVKATDGDEVYGDGTATALVWQGSI